MFSREIPSGVGINALFSHYHPRSWKGLSGREGVFFRGSVFFSFFFYANIAHRRPRRDGVVVYVNLNR